MTETSENITISKKKAAGLLLLVLFIFGFYQYQYHFDFFGSIWRTAKRGEVGHMQIQIYAGCHPKNGIQNSTDEEFTALWNVQSKAYDFTYEDVKNSMFEYCPPQTLEDIENGKYPFIQDKKDVESYKEVLRDSFQYQLKFLNREFSVLKEFKK